MFSYINDPGGGGVISDSLIDQMAGYIGTTVTIYTAGGGESGLVYGLALNDIPMLLKADNLRRSRSMLLFREQMPFLVRRKKAVRSKLYTHGEP